MKVKGKVAIVTGASSGIGLETAKLLSEKGAKVVLAARSKDKLDELAATLPDSLVVKTDMADEKQVKEMIKNVNRHFGGVDILVNNAGVGYDALVEKIESDKFNYLINLNLVSPLIAMQEVIPLMRKRGGGAIINISSGTSRMAIPNIGAYSSLKRALNGFSLTAREELAKDKINVSLVYPFITATNFGQNILGGKRKWSPQDRDSELPPADSPEYIAEKILEAIETGEAEIFAHDWMKENR